VTEQPAESVRPAPLRWGRRELRFDRGMLLMGVLNVTPDSFSDGGKFLDLSQAVDQGLRLVEEGADLLDIGGESTRPGAQSVGEGEELRRVIPVIEALATRVEVPLSVDTYRPGVAWRALEMGAALVNDVTGLQGDRRMAEVVTEHRVPVIAMHMQGTPGTMQDNPSYTDCVGEIAAFLRQSVERAVQAGLPREFVIVDPGIGFGKSFAHNHEILTSLPRLLALGQPLLLGPSRKAFLGEILGLPAQERDAGTAAVALHAAAAGVHLFRAHNVSWCRQVLQVNHWLERGPLDGKS
jgi:dihydropteroate synthase